MHIQLTMSVSQSSRVSVRYICGLSMSVCVRAFPVVRPESQSEPELESELESESNVQMLPAH